VHEFIDAHADLGRMGIWSLGGYPQKRIRLAGRRSISIFSFSCLVSDLVLL